MDTYPIFKGTDVNFHQFLDKSLTDVSFPYMDFRINCDRKQNREDKK
jgi:hypothetical protein